jgi:predicted metal-dependent peptidase
MLSSVASLGVSEITTEGVDTAATNGRDKYYNPDYLNTLGQEEVIGLDIHELGHIFLNQIPRCRDMIEEDPKLANAAMDYTDNAFIRKLDGYGVWFRLPAGHLYDPMFENWTTRMVYNYFRTGRNPETGEDDTNGEGVEQNLTDVRIGDNRFSTEQADSHDTSTYDAMSDEDKQELQEKIAQAIQEASIFAGAAGDELPRAVTDAMMVEHDWRETLSEFFNSALRGQDEYTFKKFNRRRIVDNLYRPSKYTEKVGRVIIANDTSGSIDDKAMNVWMGALASLCEQCEPDEAQVLWWDSEVRGDQTLTGSYSNLREVLKPSGGGGTHVSSVADYINKHCIQADCMVVFTDGYTESEIKWDTNIPTLWVVTESSSFSPPKGRVIRFNK